VASLQFLTKASPLCFAHG